MLPDITTRLVLGRRVITILGAWAIAAANTCEFLAVLVFGTDVSTTVSAGFAILVIGLYSLSTNAVRFDGLAYNCAT